MLILFLRNYFLSCAFFLLHKEENDCEISAFAELGISELQFMENSEPIVISDSDDQEKDGDEMEIEDILPKNNMTWV